MSISKQVFSSFIILASLLVTLESKASTFKRFWAGYSKPGLTSEQFVNDINTKIIPATRELFANTSGLLSYLPVISNAKATSSSDLIASEFALLEYESEEVYRRFRATADGVLYGELHWEMFEKSKSKSAVVEPFTGSIQTGHAYDLLSSEIDWKRASTYFTIYTRNPKTSEAEFLQSVRSFIEQTISYGPEYGLQASMVLVMNDHIAVYEAWNTPRSKSDYEDALNSDMPTGEISLQETADLQMNIQLKQRRFILPGQGSKFAKP